MTAALTKEYVKELVLDFIEREGRNPRAKDFGRQGVGCTIKPVYRIWGSMGKMFEDIEVISNRTRWDKEKIISQVKLLIEEIGHFPTKDEINKKSKNNMYYPSENPIYKYVGNMETLAKECGEKYLPRKGFSVPVDDPIYGYFVSTIEHRIFHQLLKYIEPEDIERQVKYSELFEHIDSNHTADFYLLKYGLIIEATSKSNNIPGYSEKQKWKKSLSDNVIFVYSTQDVDDLMEKII